MPLSLEEIFNKLPDRRIRSCEFLLRHEYTLYDVKSVNRRKKTATVITGVGDMIVNLDEVQEFMTYEEFENTPYKPNSFY